MANDHVQVQIVVDNVGITRAGFGVPLIVSHNAGFADRVRFYTSSSAVLEDFDSDSPEYLAAVAFFSQTPKPPRIMIGRASGLVTQRYVLDTISVNNSFEHELAVQGEGFDAETISYTSDSASSQSEIHAGLIAALNAVASKNYTAAAAALVNPDDTFTAATTDVCTAVAHGLITGDGPFQVSSSGTLPTGLTTATDYWFIRLDADTFKLASSLANALAGTAIDISSTGSGIHTIADTGATQRPSDPFTVTGSAAGNWFSVSVPREARNILSISQNHAAPSGTALADDLSAMLLADGTFYQIHTLYNSRAYVLAAAAWASANSRTYVFDVADYAIINTSISGADDLGNDLLALGYSGVAGAWHPRPAAMFAAAWMGSWLPTDPGAATAKFRTLEGVEAVEFTDTQKVNIRARRMNSYESNFGRSITWEGTVFSTVYRFLDVRRDVDWLTDEVTKAVFGILAGAPKVPYTNAGIAMVEGAIRGSMSLAVSQDVLAEGTTAVEVPDISDVPAQDKADRILRNVKFSGTLTGAIHAVIPVSGVVTF